MDILKKFSEQKTAYIIDNETDDESELKFKVKEHFDFSFINNLTSSILLFLEECKYDNLLSVIFDKSSMDIVVNGKRKVTVKHNHTFFNIAKDEIIYTWKESFRKRSEITEKY